MTWYEQCTRSETQESGNARVAAYRAEIVRAPIEVFTLTAASSARQAPQKVESVGRPDDETHADRAVRKFDRWIRPIMNNVLIRVPAAILIIIAAVLKTVFLPWIPLGIPLIIMGIGLLVGIRPKTTWKYLRPVFNPVIRFMGDVWTRVKKFVTRKPSDAPGSQPATAQ